MSDNNNGQASPVEAAANKIKKKSREALNGKTETKLGEAKKMHEALANLIASIVEDHAAVGITLTPADIFKIVAEL